MLTMITLVGVAGLEPATSRSQTVRSSQLNYTPLYFANVTEFFCSYDTTLILKPVNLSAIVPYQDFWLNEDNES